MKTIHLIGNAHIDPVWLWRFPDGLAEIKATFRSALDRIRTYDEFVFTSACAFYYQWVEENCPEMFREIQAAVAVGKWKLVGAMWVQPDCNMPSAESFARHFLYSQRYFQEKFGVTVKTGYNVDSFGHTAAMPSLLHAGGMENYVYLRPSEGAEKEYPFNERVFRWRHGEEEVLAFRIYHGYNEWVQEEQDIAKYEDCAMAQSADDFCLFFGVGNHGGGPTIANIEHLLAYREKARTALAFSHPDRYFEQIRAKEYDRLPIYAGELQNHASGCYSANSRVKLLNRRAESMLGEAEVMASLSGALIGHRADHAAMTDAWKALLFNQFHDVLCGCSVKAAYEDAYAFMQSAIATGLRQCNSAAQRVSWAVDTSKGVRTLSKETDNVLWEQDQLGTPLVVFNPLAHEVTVPVYVHGYRCAAVTDEHDTPVPFQIIRADYTDGWSNKYGIRFMATVPPLGYRTYWSYQSKSFTAAPTTEMIAELHRLKNDRIEVIFDETRGCISAIRTKDGQDLIGKFAARAIVIDDKENDTWGHNRFYFDGELGEFGAPAFSVVENGPCQISLEVTQRYQNSTLIQTYTLYPQDERVYVSANLVWNEPLAMLKLSFDSGCAQGRWIREIPGGIAEAPMDGREQPMLRYMLVEGEASGLAVINRGKYSASAKDGELRMVIARSCYYADHYGARDDRMALQDIGEQEFSYVIQPYRGDLAAVAHTAEELHTDFVAITETYHQGALPQCSSLWHCDAESISLITWKNAEDGNGRILRLAETAGRKIDCRAELAGRSLTLSFRPFEIKTLRLTETGVTACNFVEQ